MLISPNLSSAFQRLLANELLWRTMLVIKVTHLKVNKKCYDFATDLKFSKNLENDVAGSAINTMYSNSFKLNKQPKSFYAY